MPYLPRPRPPLPKFLGLVVIATLAALTTLRTPFVPTSLTEFTLCAGGAGALVFLCRKWRCIVYAVVAMAAMLVTLASAGRWQSQLLPEACERQDVQFRGQVSGLPISQETFGETTYSFTLDVHSITPSGCANPRRLRLFMVRRFVHELSGPDTVLQPGDVLRGSARLKRPWGFVNPNAEQGERRYAVDNVHGLGNVSVLSEHRNPVNLPVMQRVHRLRASIAGELLDRVDSQVAPLLIALAVGDQRFMVSEHWDQLRTFGITHLLVVSGLHVSFLAVPGWWLGRGLGHLLRALRCRPGIVRLLPYLCSLGLAAAYSTLAGLSLPTVRALATLTLVFIPGMFSRPLDRSRVFAACALSLFIISPVSALGASFWLSLTAVGLLLWLSLWQRGAPAVLLLKTQCYLVFAMLPVSLAWFGVASTIGAAANLVAVPLVTWCLLPALLIGVLLSRFEFIYGFYLIDIAGYIAGICWAFLTKVSVDGMIPGDFKAGPPALYLGAALLAGLVIALPRFTHCRILVLLLLVPLVVSPPRPDQGVVIRVLDVGQGTAVLISHHFDHALYDTGRSSNRGQPRIAGALMPLALAKGMRGIDLLVISHADDDHNGGESYIMSNLPPQEVLRGGVDKGNGVTCRPGLVMPLGPDSWLQSLSKALPGDADNDGSCVLLLNAYGRRVLLPGDIEWKRERELVEYWGEQLRADVLLAAHHGSNTSTSRLFLRSVDPALVVITSGRANRFGHPSTDVLANIAQHGAQTLNTAYDGAITLRISPDGQILCSRQRHRLSPFWMAGSGSRNCGVMPVPSQV